MGIMQRIGNLFMRTGDALGGDPAYVPNVRKMFEYFGDRFSMYYDGASTSRTRTDWGITTDTPYNNLSGDLKKLISRARESTDNNGLSQNIDNVYCSNVVKTGIKPEPVVMGLDGETPDEELNKILADGWNRYNDQWDRSGYGTYYEWQGIALRTIINSGSVLRNTVPSKKGDYLPFANQMIEPDRLDWSHDLWTKPMSSDAAPGKQTQFGMELDEWGVPLRFWVLGIKNPIDAANMDIRYVRRRTEQFIGVPWKAPVLKSLWDLDKLLEDKFMSSRILAMIALWTKADDAPRLAGGADSNNRIKWEPARIMYSKNKPEVIQAADSIADTFDPLCRLIQRTISIGTGLSYQILTKDLVGMNFAASRANILEDRRLFEMVQKWYIKNFCQRDWENYVYQMFLSGKMSPLGISDYQADPWRFNQCYWQSPGWDWVDPLKDANAAIELRKNNMLSLKDYYSSGGQNYKAELRQIAKEKAYLAELETEYDVDMSTAKQVAAKATEAAAGAAADKAQNPDEKAIAQQQDGK